MKIILALAGAIPAQVYAGKRSARHSGWHFSLIAAIGLLGAAWCEEPAKPAKPEEVGARVEKLIAQLGDEDFTKRQAAEDELSKIGFPAFKKLRAAMDGGDAEIAARARRLIGDYDQITALLDKLPQDWHTTLYHDFATPTHRAIAAHKAAAVPYIAARIAVEKDPLYGFNCVSILNEIPGTEKLPVLRGLVKNAHPWTRVESVWALGNAEDAEALPLILEAMEKDADETVRKEAQIALGKIAGIRMLGVYPGGSFVFSSDSHMTAEARAELARLLQHFMRHKSFPEAEKLDGLVYRNRVWAFEDENLKGEWKVKTFSDADGKGRWIVVRFEKEPESPARKE